MFFKTKLHSAIMGHVQTKIKQADEDYKKRLLAHKAEYKKDLVSAKQMWLQKQAIALEESLQGVLKSLLE